MEEYRFCLKVRSILRGKRLKSGRSCGGSEAERHVRRWRLWRLWRRWRWWLLRRRRWLRLRRRRLQLRWRRRRRRERGPLCGCGAGARHLGGGGSKQARVADGRRAELGCRDGALMEGVTCWRGHGGAGTLIARASVGRARQGEDPLLVQDLV